MRYNVNYISERIIQTFVIMLNYKHTQLDERQATDKINMLKEVCYK